MPPRTPPISGLKIEAWGRGTLGGVAAWGAWHRGMNLPLEALDNQYTSEHQRVRTFNKPPLPLQPGWGAGIDPEERILLQPREDPGGSDSKQQRWKA